MNDTQSFDQILGDFSPATETISDRVSDGKMVGIWIPAEYKARYDKLQLKSRLKFGKKAREVLLALIEAAEARTA
jgi:hypothetical protein